jgi:uncharacterized protein YbjT (DUF2867 family)
MKTNDKKALVMGATGLVGKEIIQQLLDHPAYSTVVALTRRPLDFSHPKLQVVVCDFNKPDASLLTGDEIYSALGTTRRKAGSKSAQYQVDYTYGFEFGRLAAANGVGKFLLVSSVGANRHSSIFYLQTKGALETDLEELPFRMLGIVRPSILSGKRAEFRPLERLGLHVMNLLRLVTPLRYQPIAARVLINLANTHEEGLQVVESEWIQMAPK